ncbi:MAG: DAK2 domain-containing protein [Bacillota bacterium]|nr:DAK2 domain-containing protein [Bacillota bacterium]
MTNNSKENVFLNGNDLRHMIMEACKYFEKYKEAINDLNVFPVPDGDTGTNMSLTMMAAAKELQTFASESIGEVARVAAYSSLMGARGNSGVILSQLFRGIARGLSGKEQARITELGRAFQYGIVYAYNAVSKPVEGTILTVAREIAKGSRAAIQTPLEFTDFLRIGIESGKKALERTPEMLPVLKEAGVVDAGGLGLIVFLEGCLHSMLKRTAQEQGTTYIDENETFSMVEISEQPAAKITSGNISEEFDPSLPYCTELIIKGSGMSSQKIRQSLEGLGDSLLVAGEDNLVKVHIHTGHPGDVLESCLAQGSIHDIKIDNMIDQFKETQWGRLSAKSQPVRPTGKVTGGIGVITVSSGEGLDAIFLSLGSDKIVSGGQSMNPSVKEIVDAVIEVPSDHIIILPNNSNIKLSAEQAADLVEKDVMVVDTRSLPQGLAAMLGLDKKKTLLENHQEMCERAKQVKTGEVTYATRDTTVNNIRVTKGSIIGISDGNLLICGSSVESATRDLINTILSDEDEVLTLFYGQDVTGKQAQEIVEILSGEYPDLEIELQYGGQPLYYYLLSIE